MKFCVIRLKLINLDMGKSGKIHPKFYGCRDLAQHRTAYELTAQVRCTAKRKVRSQLLKCKLFAMGEKELVKPYIVP